MHPLWTKKLSVLSIVFSIALLGVNTTVFGRWHFHGGNVIDVSNEIKQIALKIKESDIAKELKNIAAYGKQYNETFKELQEIKIAVQDTLGSLRGLRNAAGGILDTPKQAKKEIEKLYSPSFIVEHPATSLKDYSLYIRQRESAEQEATLTRSNQIGQVNETIADETAKIMSDYSSGVISEQQKNLLLKSMLVQSKNSQALVNNQILLGEITQEAAETAENNVAEIAGKMQQTQITTDNNPETAERMKKVRLPELPR